MCAAREVVKVSVYIHNSTRTRIPCEVFALAWYLVKGEKGNNTRDGSKINIVNGGR